MGLLCSLDNVKSCFSQNNFSSNITTFSVEKRRNSNPLSSKDFKRKMLLGVGSYGKVLLVKKKDNDETLAMKILKKKDVPDPAMILMERHIMIESNHPFIVNLKYAFQDESHVAFLMEYLEGGDLLSSLNAKRHKRSFFSIAKFYMAEIVSALEYLHKIMHVFYGDLKLNNILMDGDGHIRLIDFGSSKIIENGKKTKGFCGTPNYIAPEIVLGMEYDKSADIWSLGCAFYEIFMDRPPFSSKSDDLLYKKIVEEKAFFPEDCPTVARDLIKGLLAKNPNDRFSIDQIKNHEFFYNTNWDDVLEQKITPPIALKLTELSEDSEDCTTNNSSIVNKSFIYESRNNNFEHLSKKLHTDHEIENEFAELFQDYTTKSLKSLDRFMA